MSPEEDRTRDTVDSEPMHYQLSYSSPPRGLVCAHPSHGLKRSWHPCPRWVNVGNTNMPSLHHPGRRNVTIRSLSLSVLYVCVFQCALCVCVSVCSMCVCFSSASLFLSLCLVQFSFFFFFFFFFFCLFV